MALFDFLKKKEFEEIKQLKSQLKRYQPINDVEQEVKRQQANLQNLIATKSNELEQLIQVKKNEQQTVTDALNKLNTDYAGALEVYTRLRKEVGLFENKLDLIEYGVYEPVYSFDRSDEYREEQNKIIEQQKLMIKFENAAVCRTTWTIDGSEAKGKANTKRYIKLTLRAFNGECDALIAKVKWNNVNQMKQRIVKSFETINKIGESQTVEIRQGYLDLKLKELALEYEYQQKRQEEKEILRAAQEEMREEEKARRDFEQAQREAEKEEANYQKALDKARKELMIAKGERHDELQSRIAQLEEELQMAHEKKERAISMAQQTKRGHVYIISNIGSFGEHVYKIGMTRRLEPLDRVKELGDASVPFQFDIHAMIFSEEAPTLENELHKAFASKKVNMVNYRKEFFKVTLDEIEQKTREIGLETEFIRLPEAYEFKETMAIIEKLNSLAARTVEELIAEEFPASLTSTN